MHQIEEICEEHAQLEVAKSFHPNDNPQYYKFLYEYAKCKIIKRQREVLCINEKNLE